MGKALVIGGLVLIVGAIVLLKGMVVKPRATNPKPAGVVEVTPTPVAEPVVQKLTLSVSSPADGAVVRAASVTVKGKTAPNAEVSINDVDTKADTGGNFSAVIKLDEGENYVVVVATDDNGDFAKLEMTVNSETFE